VRVAVKGGAQGVGGGWVRGRVGVVGGGCLCFKSGVRVARVVKQIDTQLVVRVVNQTNHTTLMEQCVFWGGGRRLRVGASCTPYALRMEGTPRLFLGSS